MNFSPKLKNYEKYFFHKFSKIKKGNVVTVLRMLLQKELAHLVDLEALKSISKHYVSKRNRTPDLQIIRKNLVFVITFELTGIFKTVFTKVVIQIINNNPNFLLFK